MSYINFFKNKKIKDTFKDKEVLFDKFDVSKKYVFDIEVAIANDEIIKDKRNNLSDEEWIEYCNVTKWINFCNGKEVKIEDEYTGTIYDPELNKTYHIFYRWCREI